MKRKCNYFQNNERLVTGKDNLVCVVSSKRCNEGYDVDVDRCGYSVFNELGVIPLCVLPDILYLLEETI